MLDQTETFRHDYSVTNDALGSLKRLIEGTKEDVEDQLNHVLDAISTASAAQREAHGEDLSFSKGAWIL